MSSATKTKSSKKSRTHYRLNGHQIRLLRTYNEVSFSIEGRMIRINVNDLDISLEEIAAGKTARFRNGIKVSST